MIRVKLQRLFVERVSLLELVGFVIPNREVIGCLKIGELPVALLPVIDCRLDLPLLCFYDGQVVQSLMIVRPITERYFEGLNREFQLPENGINVANVVPNITVNDGIIFPLQDSPFKAIVIQMVLMVSEAT